VRFDLWAPIYHEILEDFGFSRERDEEAASLLSGLLRRKSPQDLLKDASDIVRDRMVIVCGNAPSLASEIERLPSKDGIFIAADGAAGVLLNSGIVPRIVVTDLDGPFATILQADREGSIIVVHAHGDNIDALKRCVPKLRNVIGTTQSAPLDNVYNFGGFTDGDRCVFLAQHLGAADIRLIGFDYDDPSVTPRKRKKLSWAKRLIEMALAADHPLEPIRPSIAERASSATSSALLLASTETNLLGSRAARCKKFSSTPFRNSTLSNLSMLSRDLSRFSALTGSMEKRMVVSGTIFQGLKISLIHWTGSQTTPLRVTP
jgi:uncharacterized Rossmann fold enzyme